MWFFYRTSCNLLAASACHHCGGRFRVLGELLGRLVIFAYLGFSTDSPRALETENGDERDF